MDGMEGPQPKPGAGTPRVSVLLPAYGVAHMVGDALASLQAQTMPDWEAIVVDDGAPDDVAGAVRPFLADPRIRLLETDNGGLAVARNRAAAAARAPILSLLDGDDRYAPEYLATMLAAIDADERVGFVTCDAIITGLPAREGQLFSAFTSMAGPITLERVLRRQVNIFGACTIRRTAFDAVGGYDEGLRSAEDLDLWVRLLEAGWTAARVDAPLMHYYRRPDSLSADTGNLLRAVIRVYENAITRLGDRPEAAAARAMRDRTRTELAWEEGEALVRNGDVAAGLRLLRQSGAAARSARWRVAMPLMTAFPALARPFLMWRERSGAGG